MAHGVTFLTEMPQPLGVLPASKGISPFAARADHVHAVDGSAGYVTEPELTAERDARIAAAAAEKTARIAADTTLTTNLAAESSVRSAADATLTANLAAEAATRAAADSAEASTRAADDAVNAAAIAAETARALAAEALLIGGTLTATRVPYATGPHTLADDARMTWDSVANGLTVSDIAISCPRIGSSGFENEAFGFGTMSLITTGFRNTAVGYGAGYGMQSAFYNTVMGAGALGGAPTSAANNNAALGTYAMRSSVAPTGCTALGSHAQYDNLDSQETTAVGHLAGYNAGAPNQHLSYCTLLGAYANTNSGTTANSTAIGANAQATANNQMVFGSGVVQYVFRAVPYTFPAADGIGPLTSDGAGGLAWGPLRLIGSGAAPRTGLAVLALGVATVATAAVTASSRIFLTSNVDGGVVGWLRVTSITPGTGFTITSSSLLDTSSVAWMLVEQA